MNQLNTPREEINAKATREKMNDTKEEHMTQSSTTLNHDTCPVIIYRCVFSLVCHPFLKKKIIKVTQKVKNVLREQTKVIQLMHW